MPTSRIGEGSAAEQIHRALSAPVHHILMNRPTCAFFEKFAKVIRAHAGDRRQFSDVQLSTERLLDELDDPAQPVCWHASSEPSQLNGPNGVPPQQKRDESRPKFFY